jgi:hypothetical protein
MREKRGRVREGGREGKKERESEIDSERARGREGGRAGGRERGREGGREGGREREREGECVCKELCSITGGPGRVAFDVTPMRKWIGAWAFLLMRCRFSYHLE